jgi:hypothetical protein
MMDVVPYIDYPDFYRAALGFGFDLPQEWSGAWDQSARAIHFDRPPYRLTVFYDDPDYMARGTFARIGTLAGQIEIDGFWDDTVLEKFWLTITSDRPGMVVYFAQGPLNGLWLTAYLECLGEGCAVEIPYEIEDQADRLLASYEEHGWEE